MNGHPNWNEPCGFTNGQVTEMLAEARKDGYEAGWQAAGGGIRPEARCPGSGQPPARVTQRFNQGHGFYSNQPRKGDCGTCGKNLTINSDGGMYKHRKGTQ